MVFGIAVWDIWVLKTLIDLDERFGDELRERLS